MNGSASVNNRHAAFTLLEVMIVCSLAAVLLALATPSYQRYLLRSHRSAAIEALVSAAACQGRIYASQLSYDTRRCLTGTDDAFYRFRFEPAESAAADGFVAIAEPLQTGITDPCGALSLDHTGRRGISGPSKLSRACWEGR